MAKERLSDAQLRNQREQALRAVRRLQRTVDTDMERMERSLDRAIENKERITIRLILNLADRFRTYIVLVNKLQQGLADAIQIFLR